MQWGPKREDGSSVSLENIELKLSNLLTEESQKQMSLVNLMGMYNWQYLPVSHMTLLLWGILRSVSHLFIN